ncbi:MAG: ATPase [Treponema sp.]|jgi:vacuolar-type H+-ATPase subunit E/Vma4|nr:ATPase [Treponema sp.]
MEELQSTEVLDREILEDARRKAFRILRGADDTVKANAQSWKKKSDEAITGLERRYALRQKRSAQEIMARLPLDKRRAKAERIEAFLLLSAERWYKKQPRERIIGLLETEMKSRLEEAPGSLSESCRLIYAGLEKAEAETVIAGALGEASIPKSLSLEEAHVSSLPALTLDSPAVMIKVSIEMILDSILHEKREELVGALLGPEALTALSEREVLS